MTGSKVIPGPWKLNLIQLIQIRRNLILEKQKSMVVFKHVNILKGE